MLKLSFALSFISVTLEDEIPACEDEGLINIVGKCQNIFPQDIITDRSQYFVITIWHLNNMVTFCDVQQANFRKYIMK